MQHRDKVLMDLLERSYNHRNAVAFKQLVDKEDIMEWGKKPNPEFKVIPPMPVTKSKPNKPFLVGLFSKVLP